MTVFESIVGDITLISADAIVNAANTPLHGGGGVDGAIHRAAGPQLKAASVALAPCPPGEAKITPGFDLPAKWVIHAVGPIWAGGTSGEAELLAAAYRNSLHRAIEVAAQTVVFPGISTGAYGYPVEAATRIAVTEITAFITKHSDALERITLIWLDPEHAYQASALIKEVSR